MPHALSVTGLRKAYGSVQALRGVDLELGTGELFGLLGPNGAGKSTLVKIACGLVRPSSGSVEICGNPAGSLAAQAQIGYLAELFRFPDWCTADELLGLHQELTGSPGGAAERRELLELVELGHVPERRVGAMSKGMQQRLGLAQALVGSPRLLLLDEPTSALDPSGRHTVRALLERLRERGVSVLLNSHLLSEVELVCDRVAIINGGEVVAAGTPAQLSRPGGVEVETGTGVRAFPAATREDAPRIVRDLVAAGEDVFAVRVLTSTLEDAYLEAVGRAPAPPRRRGGRAAGGSAMTTPESAGLAPPRPLRGALIVARFSLRESLRRRVFIVIGVLTVVFLVLYGLATWQAFVAADDFTGGTEAGVEADKVVGATLAGLAMFAILFLGTILAVFLTLGAVRGDAERGLLQPLLVRPLPRRTLLLGRWLGATAVCAPYVMLIALGAFALTFALGGWWPDRLIGPLLTLALAVAIIAALSLAGSIVLASTANGIAVFMLFGAGLTAGLLGQIAEAIGSDSLDDISRIATWALPFEALYQAGLAELTVDTVGFTRLAIDLGPFGGARAGRRRPLALVAGLPGRGRRRGRGRVHQARPLGAVEVVLDRQRGSARLRADGRLIGRVGRRLDADHLRQLARLVHLGDDVAAPDQLAAHEQLRDRRPVRQRGQLLADPRVGQDVDRRERHADRLERRDGARGEAAARRLGRPLHEQEDVVLGDRLLDRGADLLLGSAHLKPTIRIV